MRAPAEPVVLRHCLTHPSDGPADIERHTGIRLDTADRVLKRIRADPDLKRLHSHGPTYEEAILRRVRPQMARLARREHLFHLPDPFQWAKNHRGKFWLGGEVAAAEADGLPIRPARLLAYVQDLGAAARTALNLFAKLSARSEANLILREADPWLRPDDRKPNFVEKGQRLLDVDESPETQLARSMVNRR